MRAACLIVASCALALAGGPDIELPRDPKAVVIRLDYKGGFRAPTKVPPLEIRADGSVRIAVADKAVDGKLSEADLTALLRFAVAEHRFFEFDAEAVAAEVRKTGKDPDLIVEDAATTEITIVTRDRQATKAWHALGFAARQHRGVAALQDLAAIERRLHNVVQIVQAGGTAAAKELLAAANGQLQREHPGVAAMELTDLVRFTPWRSGGKDALFEREEPDRVVRVTVVVPPDDDPHVRVELAPPRG